jgi:hypothetical protein|tara:strand:+ start:570 stop:1115 length:546 start_codon:yes stop_codon:yes gene_type:complete
MTWFNLLKQPKLRTSSKITTNLGVNNKEEDEQCRKKIKEYFNKIKTMGGPNILVNMDDRNLDYLTEKEFCIFLRQINKIDVNNLKPVVASRTRETKYRQETDSSYSDNSLIVISVLYLRQYEPSYYKNLNLKLPNTKGFEHSATWYLACYHKQKGIRIYINISANVDELGEKEALKAVDFR